jgi:hypothetical protein
MLSPRLTLAIGTIFQFTRGNPPPMKLKFVSIMAAFTLTALSLTGLTIPALCAQEEPATLPLIKVDHNHSTIGFAIPILGAS